MRVRVLLSSPNSSVNKMCACKNQCKLYIDQSIYIHIYINQQITVSHFGEHKRLHLESSKQNYYIISLRAIIKAIFTSLYINVYAHIYIYLYIYIRKHTHT